MKKKKKKFKLRHNQTAPSPESPRLSDGFDQTESPLLESPSVDNPRRGLPQLKHTQSPQLDRLCEDSHGEEDGLYCMLAVFALFLQSLMHRL